MMQRASSASITKGTTGGGKDHAPEDAGLSFVLTFEGALSITPVAVRGPNHVLRVAFSDPSFHLRQGDQEGLSEAVRHDVERSLRDASYVEVSANNQAIRYLFSPTTAPLARSLVRATIASTQPVFSDGPSPTWQTTEGDSGGVFAATYLRTAEETLVRTRGAYTKLTSPKGLVPLSPDDAQKVSGNSTYTVDTMGWVTRMTGVEAMSTTVEAANQAGETRVSTSLDLLRVADQGAQVAAFEQSRHGLVGTPAATNDLALAAVEQNDRALIGKDTPASVLNRLGTLTKADAVARADIKDELSAMVRRDEKAAGLLAKAVRAGMPTLSASTVVGALAGAGTESAAVALAQIGGDASLAGDLRADATMALATSDDLSPASLAALKEAAKSDVRDVRSAGALGMGAAANALAQKDRVAADDLVTSLLARLDAATDPSERATLFNGLGNSGDPRILPRARAALARESPAVRAAAVLALRRIEDQAADDLIAATLTGDDHRSVRSSALLATSFRLPALHVPSLEASLQREPLKSLRMETVSLLGRWRSAPGAAELLLAVMKSDKEAEVRAAAEALLDG